MMIPSILRYMNCSHCELVMADVSPSTLSVVPTQYVDSSRSFTLNYTADTSYYGTDKFGIVALDGSGAFSLAYILSISIKFRHCLNDAICKVCTGVRGNFSRLTLVLCVHIHNNSYTMYYNTRRDQ